MYFYFMLIDTHTHLYVSEFDADRSDMIKRAMDAGVEQFVLPAIDSETTAIMHSLKRDYPDSIHLMMGLHPTHVGENLAEALAHVQQQLATHSFVAVGEIGMDLYWDKSNLENQKKAFKIQIQLAKKYKLPIVIHCRDAFDEIFKILESENDDDLFGIFHCFTGTEEQANKAISFNMKLGIGGVVTFKNGKIDTFLNKIDIKNIVLETDSPYLSPVPYRGKRNESSYLPLICKKLAEIYQLSEEEISLITTQNSKDVFGI